MVRLKAGSGGDASIDLRDAMLRALARNPSYILRHAQPAYSLAVLCLGRAAPLPNYKQAAAELAAIKRSFDGVRAEELRYKKELCLASLESAPQTPVRLKCYPCPRYKPLPM